MSGHSQSQSSLISILEIVRESFIIVSGGFCPRKMMFFPEGLLLELAEVSIASYPFLSVFSLGIFV